MKKILLLATIVVSCFLVASGSAYAAEPLSAHDIMTKANDINMGESASGRLTMIVTNFKGDTSTTELVTFRKKFSDREANIMFFTLPVSMKDIGFLSVDYTDENKADQRWMYTPAIRKLSRIASKDRRLSFLNSDFSYADMSVRNTESYNYGAPKEDTLNGQKVWVIEGTPLNEGDVEDDGYSKSVFYVRQDAFIVVRIVNTLKSGGKEKQMDLNKIEQVDGVWVIGDVSMTTRKAGVEISKTTMKTADVKLHETFDDKFFSERQLSHPPK